MNALNKEECILAHDFNEYYSHLKDAHLTEGVLSICDPAEIIIINACLAAVLTMKKNERKEDYFE